MKKINKLLITFLFFISLFIITNSTKALAATYTETIAITDQQNQVQQVMENTEENIL